MDRQTRLDRKYIEGDSWRCSEAPVNPECPQQVKHQVGAHYWAERWCGDKLGKVFICKYCFEIRKFPTKIYLGGD
jgi:hypothetical protein